MKKNQNLKLNTFVEPWNLENSKILQVYLLKIIAYYEDNLIVISCFLSMVKKDPRTLTDSHFETDRTIE